MIQHSCCGGACSHPLSPEELSGRVDVLVVCEAEYTGRNSCQFVFTNIGPEGMSRLELCEG